MTAYLLADGAVQGQSQQHANKEASHGLEITVTIRVLTQDGVSSFLQKSLKHCAVKQVTDESEQVVEFQLRSLSVEPSGALV